MTTHGVDLSIFFAGTAGSVPTARRGLPAVLVRRGGERILVDCGEGTQRQLLTSVGLADLDAILLTHFHTDHWLGLPGMLGTFGLRGRERPLTVYGPPGIGAVMELVRRISGRPGFPLDTVELAAHDTIRFDGYGIDAIPVVHRGAAYGYVLREDARPGVFDPEAARAAGLAPGPDFGRVQRGETVDGVRPEAVMGPPRPGRALAISGDTRPTTALCEAAAGADVLVHEATFAEEEHDRAIDNGHSTARGAAALARDAGVRLLALTHVSTRHPLGRLREEARATFPATVTPHDFDTIEIPQPERGAPRLVRWSERAAPETESDSPGPLLCSIATPLTRSREARKEPDAGPPEHRRPEP